MVKILVVEDDEKLSKIICNKLERSGYLAKSCSTGASGLEEFKSDEFDLVLTDIMMPKMDGFEFAESVKELNERVPIIFMSARDDMPSKSRGFRIGIDDYLVKPFDLDELILRISAVLRRSHIKNVKKIKVGNFEMNEEEYSATCGGENVILTVREFNILLKMLSYPKKIFTRSALMEEFWDFDSSSSSRTVDVSMAKIREKTQNCDGFEILTVHGLGYKLVLKNE